MPTPLNAFICYSHEDRSTVESLLKHLRQLEKKALLNIWDDGKILAGQDWDKSIKIHLEKADLILLFVSADFLASEYIEKTEMQAALQRHRDGLSILVPVIVRACDWMDYFEIGKFQALPQHGNPMRSAHFPFEDDAHYQVYQGVKAVVVDLHKRLMAVEEAESIKVQTEQIVAQQKAEAKRVEKIRHRRDEIAWQKVQDEVKYTIDLSHKIEIYRTYLSEQIYVNHRDEAQVAIAGQTH